LERIRTYECMCLLDNREVRNGWQALKDSVAGIFQKHGAQIVSSRRWDERRLAYPIRGQQRGTYLLTYLKADTQQLTGIRRDLQFNEAVLRNLLVACAEVPQSAFEPEAAFDASQVVVEEAVARPTAPASAESEAGAGATATDRAEKADRAARADKAERGARADRADKAEKAERAEKAAEKAGKAEKKTEKTEKPEKAEKPEKTEKAEKPEAEKPEKTEKADKADKHGGKS